MAVRILSGRSKRGLTDEIRSPAYRIARDLRARALRSRTRANGRPLEDELQGLSRQRQRWDRADLGLALRLLLGPGRRPDRRLRQADGAGPEARRAMRQVARQGHHLDRRAD